MKLDYSLHAIKQVTPRRLEWFGHVQRRLEKALAQHIEGPHV